MVQDVLLPLLMRWTHVITAVVAVGGVFFMRVILTPVAASVLEGEAHDKLRAAIVRRWKLVVHLSILLFLITGFYTYLFVTRHEHAGQFTYHMLFGVKFLLALPVFFLASALTSTRDWAERFRTQRGRWTALLLLLAFIVILLGGYLKNMEKQYREAPAPTQASGLQTPE